MTNRVFNGWSLMGGMALCAAIAAPALGQNRPDWLQSDGRVWLRESNWNYNISNTGGLQPRIDIEDSWQTARATDVLDGPVRYSFSQSFADQFVGANTIDINIELGMEVVGNAIVMTSAAWVDLEFTNEYTGTFQFGLSNFDDEFKPLLDVIQGETVNVFFEAYAFGAKLETDSNNFPPFPQIALDISSNEFVGVQNGRVGVIAAEGDSDGVILPSGGSAADQTLADRIDQSLQFADDRIATRLNVAQMEIDFNTNTGDDPTEFNGRYAFGSTFILGTVPAPGAGLLFAIGGLTASRRRR